MSINVFNHLTEEDKSESIQRLIENSAPSQSFFLLIVLAVLMATLGLLANNVAIIIGSMLIAPMLYPFLTLSLGIIISDQNLLRRSFYTILKAIGISIVTATLASLLFPMTESRFNSEIIDRTNPSLIFGAVALISGFAAAFTSIRQQFNESLPGVAVSVSLIPPLAVIGIGIAKLDGGIIQGSLSLFLVNIIGIIAGSMVVFSLTNFYSKRTIAKTAIKKEEKLIEEGKI